MALSYCLVGKVMLIVEIKSRDIEGELAKIMARVMATAEKSILSVLRNYVEAGD